MPSKQLRSEVGAENVHYAFEFMAVHKDSYLRPLRHIVGPTFITGMRVITVSLAFRYRLVSAGLRPSPDTPRSSVEWSHI